MTGPVGETFAAAAVASLLDASAEWRGLFLTCRFARPMAALSGKEGQGFDKLSPNGWGR